VAQLKQVQIPEKMPEPEAQALDGKLDQGLHADLAGEFVSSLRRRYPVSINREAVDRLF